MAFNQCSRAVLIAGLTGACASQVPKVESEAAGQTYAQALRLVCAVDERAGITPEEDPIERELIRSDWFQAHIENPDAIYLLTMLKVRTDAERARELGHEASGNGVAPCALAQYWTSAATEDE